MNPAPGLFDLSANNARSRRRRLNLDSQSEDRLSTTITSRPNPRTTASARGRRSTAPMFFDPEIPTPGWEIYQDPSQESVEAILAQPRNMTPAMTNAASAPLQVVTSGTTSQDQAETASSSSTASTPLRHTIVSTVSDASRIVTERMIRTFEMVYVEDRRQQRQRRRQLRQQRQTHGGDDDDDDDDSGTNAHTIFMDPTSEDLITRLQARYAELTLLEEGENDQSSVHGHELQHEPEHEPEQGQDLGLERGEESQAEVAGQGQDHGLEGGEVERQTEIAEQVHDQLDMPTEMQEVIKPGERIYGPDVKVLLPVEPVPPTTSTSAEISRSMPPISGPSAATGAGGMGSGLSFAERARARGREMDVDMDTDIDQKARKRAKLTGPVLDVEDEELDRESAGPSTGITTGTATTPGPDVDVSMHDPTDPNAPVGGSLSDREKRHRDREERRRNGPSTREV